MRQKNQPKKITSTILKVALATCITAIVIVACRKVSTNESLGTADFNVAAAKEWYYGSFKKTAEYTSSTVAMGKRLPVWKQGITYKIGNIQFVEFPLAQEKKQRDLPQELTATERLRVFGATLDKVVFGKLPNGKVVTRIVRFAPTLAYLQSKGYDISSNTFNKIDHNFSGNLYVYRWNGTLVKGLVFENGTSRKAVARISKTRPVIGKGNTTAPNDDSHTMDGEEGGEGGEGGGEGDPICDYHVIYHYTQTCYVTFEGDVMGFECDDPVLEYVEYEEYNCHEATELPCSGENLTQECLCENYGFCGDDGTGGDDEDPCKNAEQEAQNIAQAQFENFISDESNTSTDEASLPSLDPYTKIVKWNVVSHINNIWRVFARTKYTISWDAPGVIGNYNKTLAVEHLESKYDGPNDIVVSDWTPGVHNEPVTGNHTEHPQCEAFVSGSIHHKMKANLKITIPGCGEITVNPGLETTKDCSNTLTITCP